MQAYQKAFARIYNLRWGSFSQFIAPKIQAYYENNFPLNNQRKMLDLCCGAGHLALHFLQAGYRVTGIDLSEDMLVYARENNAVYLEQGQGKFIQGDAANFHLDQTFGLVVSTYDALNHLPDFPALESCFRSVFQVLEKEGMFIFDLNTRQGLRRWTGISVEDTDEMMLVNRGIFDEHNGRALTRISGFIQRENGLYDRFEETVYNTIFEMDSVRKALLDTGWRSVHYARIQDLTTPLDDPESEARIFFVTRI